MKLEESPHLVYVHPRGDLHGFVPSMGKTSGPSGKAIRVAVKSVFVALAQTSRNLAVLNLSNLFL